MTARPTPFGMFAATSLGRIGEGHFQIEGRTALRRTSWLDLGYLYPLVATTLLDRNAREELEYVANPTLFRSGHEWRYIEEVETGEGRRRQLVRVGASEPLNALISAVADTRSTLRELASHLHTGMPDVSVEEAIEFLHELIDSQILRSTLTPTLTAEDPARHVIRVSEGRAPLAGLCEELKGATARLAAIDALDAGALRQAYEQSAGLLSGAGGAKHLFHVDVRRDAPELALPAAIVPPILKAVAALQKITPPGWPHAPLEQFRSRFIERYGDRRVDLMAALDQDSGIGFEADPANRRNEHLLADFKFPAPPESGQADGARSRHLFGLLERAWSEQSRQMTLADEDIEHLSVKNAPALPPVFVAFGSVLCVQPPPPDQPDRPVLLLQAVGSGLRLMGRFCRSDPVLESHVKELLRIEEAAQPEAIFAEMVYLPEDRTGNIVCRPALRQYELPCLGESGMDRSRQIRLDDLTVGIERNRIVLHSRKLGRQIVPRLTCAHNVAHASISLYRFLAALADQDVAGSLSFSWGMFGDAAFLPRVAYGAVVLSAASWRIDPAVAKVWKDLPPARRAEKVGAWRNLNGVPRWVQVGQADNLLTLDLDNPPLIDALVGELNRPGRPRVWELMPQPGDLCLHSPEGRHTNEVIIPFVRAEEASAPRPSTMNVAPERTQRRFVPGSEWLYFKLYGGLRATEDVLAGDLYGFVRSCRERGWIDRWHFVRYRDDADHIRVRLHGAAEVLRHEVQPRLQDLFARWKDSQAIWRCQFDTYERELARYGGDAAMETAEAIFDADSSFVMDLLGSAPSGGSTDWRWQLALRSVDSYHEALGLDAAQRERLAKAGDEAFRAEFSVEPDFEGQISSRFRKDRALLEALFAPVDRLPAPLQWAQAPLEAFMHALSPLTDRLAQLASASQLTVTPQDLAGSLAHMHVNRMMLGNPREHELIIYAFLQRIHRARRARP